MNEILTCMGLLGLLIIVPCVFAAVMVGFSQWFLDVVHYWSWRIMVARVHIKVRR